VNATFEQQHVSIHGHDVVYRRAGAGEAVVLVHGLAGSSRTWKDVMPTLAQDYDVIAPDLLGHGGSAKPMGDYSLGAHASGLRDLLLTLRISSATLVGHSFGGGVAMQIAYQHPELCDRLVLVSSGGLGREVSWLLRLGTLPFAEYAMPLVFSRWVADRGTEISRFLGRRGLHSAHLGELWRAYSSLAGTENRAAFVRTIRTVMDTSGQTVSAMDRLYLASHVPTLIVWGALDRIIPVAHAQAAHEAIEGSRLEILDHAGHFPHVEAPERFLEVVLQFLAETPASAGTGPRLEEILRDGR
jgi:pimeloyl-ACP methyl ester carboxylesterase